MERNKRIFTFLTFFICTGCLALLSASLATQRWIIGKPVRLSFINATGLNSSAISEDQNRKFRGEIHFGLFQGTKVLNYGFGDRLSNIICKD